jgi:hypothetical protein
MDYNFHQFNRNPFPLQVAALFLILLLSTGNAFGIIPTGTETGALQFDGIIELNSQHFQTHVLLFVRYWVSPNFYSASVVWAEPHVGSLNFSIYPITTVIDSNERSFRNTNDVHSKYDSMFSKPLGKRDIFRFMFNDYPIDNIRFAESDALQSRIFTEDFNDPAEKTKSDWQIIDINNSADEKGINREVTKLNLQINDDRLNTLKLLDAKDRLIKSIEYQYSSQNSPCLVSRQNVILPERPITLGYKSGGVTMTIDGRKKTIQEFESVHHAGSRKCTVDYETQKIADKTLALPVRVVVYDASGKDVLRSSRLINFKQVDMNEVWAGQSAEAYSSFDDNEWATRKMLLKYWMKNAGEIEEEDLKILHKLQTHFEQICDDEKTAGEKLRHINMLFQLDWILNDGEQLQRHFQQYLDVLAANDLDGMILVGGQYAIETTYRWGMFAAADRLLEKWINAAVANNNEQAILSFGQSSVRRDRLWTIVGLVDKSLASSDKWGQKRFDAQSLQCMALNVLYEMLRNPDKIQEGRRKEQANWVLSSTNKDKIQDSLKQSITDAQKTFTELKEPTPEQKALNKQLDMVSTKMTQAER